MTQPLKIVFAGTPEFGLPCLEALAQSSHDLIAIYTQPDRPAGRGRKLQISAVKEWAQAQQLPVFQPINFKSPEAVDELKALEPDLLVVIAYGLILPQKVLDIPIFGCINVHASLLPSWRGASPIQQAILHGDSESGVTIMQMNAGMDTGDILMTIACPLDSQETAGSLHDKLSQLAAKPLLNVIDKLSQQQINPLAQQNEQATYAAKINKEDGLIDWQQPAISIDRQIRAFNPWPIAYTQANQDIMRIYSADLVSTNGSHQPGTILALDKNGLLVATGEGAILITRIQFSGGKVITIRDWLNAPRHSLVVGGVLG